MYLYHANGIQGREDGRQRWVVNHLKQDNGHSAYLVATQRNTAVTQNLSEATFTFHNKLEKGVPGRGWVTPNKAQVIDHFIFI